MPNMSEQRSRSGLCEGVIRREATETEGLVYNDICIWDFFSRNQLSSTLIIHLPFVSVISGISNYIS